MRRSITLDTKYLAGVVSDNEINSLMQDVEKAHFFLLEKKGAGSDYMGWQDLPSSMGKELIEDIKRTAKEVRKRSKAIVVVGIGGSYLGARTVIEALAPDMINRDIFFAGQNISGEYLNGIIQKIKDRDISINVISKSGTTTEPAIAFRVLWELMRKKYRGKKLQERIICTTDPHKGALRRIADANGFKSFPIPDDVGGRFSVLTAVGLFPIACAGLDIQLLLDGAAQQREDSASPDPWDNISYKYAVCRNILYQKGKKIEILSNFDSRIHYISEWWKQLFGESEGKGLHSIFPASCDFSTDLHSMGQLIQEGERDIFETFLVVDREKVDLKIPFQEENIDNLNYLAGKSFDYINRKAYEATREAHFEGSVPNMTIALGELSEFTIGQLFYFFEKAVAVSGYLSGKNPFDQPGVEAYKKKMFNLLGKPE